MTTIKRQEINLYLPSLQPKFDWMAPAVIGSGLGLVLAVFVILFFVGSFNVSQLSSDIESLKIKAAQLEAQAAELQAKLPKNQTAQLDAEIADAREQIVRRQRIIALVDAQNLGNAEGFSKQMEGFARQLTPHISLSTFQLADGGGRISMTGMAGKAEVVPNFIEKLQTEKSFEGSQFGVMSIQRKSSGSVMAFSLGSGEQEESP